MDGTIYVSLPKMSRVFFFSLFWRQCSWFRSHPMHGFVKFQCPWRAEVPAEFTFWLSKQFDLEVTKRQAAGCRYAFQYQSMNPQRYSIPANQANTRPFSNYQNVFFCILFIFIILEKISIMNISARFQWVVNCFTTYRLRIFNLWNISELAFY